MEPMRRFVGIKNPEVGSDVPWEAKTMACEAVARGSQYMPSEFLKAGDVVKLSIENIGNLSNRMA
jgi:2-keto-4-pentenoate hydratase/2-oxohepta-3-ene-1,7-dioic acid hydratase in catechol pathway